jgi:hypothetical protein
MNGGGPEPSGGPSGGAMSNAERRTAIDETQTKARPRSRPAALFLFAPLVVPLVLPLLGVLISPLSLALAPSLGPRVWPSITRSKATGYAGLALVAFWALPISSFAGIGLASGWFILPLCGPANAVAWFVPAGAALVVYTAGCVTSVRLVRPIVWVVGTALAMVAYEAAWAVLEASGDAWIC